MMTIRWSGPEHHARRLGRSPVSRDADRSAQVASGEGDGVARVMHDGSVGQRCRDGRVVERGDRGGEATGVALLLVEVALKRKYAGALGCPSVTTATNSSSVIGWQA